MEQLNVKCVHVYVALDALARLYDLDAVVAAAPTSKSSKIVYVLRYLLAVVLTSLRVPWLECKL